MNYFNSSGEFQTDTLNQLEPILDIALNAHQTGDYDEYARVATGDLLSDVSRESFDRGYRKVGRPLGLLVTKRFLGAVRKAEGPLLVYAATYSQCDVELVLSVLFTEQDDELKIDWLWIE